MSVRLVPLLVPTSPLLVTVLQVVAVPHRSHLLAPPVHVKLLSSVRVSLHVDTEPLRPCAVIEEDRTVSTFLSNQFFDMAVELGKSLDCPVCMEALTDVTAGGR